MATKLQFTENFTIEVPKSDGTFDEIIGKVLAITPKLEKAIKLKFKERDEIAKKNKKKQNKISRLQQKAENIQQRINAIDNSALYNDMINDFENGIINYADLAVKETIEEMISKIKNYPKKYELLEKQQDLLDDAYTLSDELEEAIENSNDENISEVIAKEHISNRVKTNEENKAKLDAICENYGYTIVWETILKDIKEGKQQDTKN